MFESPVFLWDAHQLVLPGMDIAPTVMERASALPGEESNHLWVSTAVTWGDNTSSIEFKNPLSLDVQKAATCRNLSLV